VTRIGDLFARDLVVINVGAEVFAEALKRIGVRVVHVQWTPTAGGDPRLTALLEKLADEDDEA